MVALRRGEPAAFDRMYARYHGRIWAFLARLAPTRAEAEDLYQETWLAAARHARRLEPGSELLQWLYTVAHNKQRSARRLRLFDARRRERLATEPVHQVRTPEEQAQTHGEGVAVEEALARLPGVHREVIVLCVVEGLDARRAGAVLGAREDAVRKRLSRARAALAEALADRVDRPRRTQGGQR